MTASDTPFECDACGQLAFTFEPTEADSVKAFAATFAATGPVLCIACWAAKQRIARELRERLRLRR